MKRHKTEFIILEAFNGDSILVKTFDEGFEEFIILIDGGTSSCFEHALKKELKEIFQIDLLVLTHIDSDHIGGLIKFFNNSIINEINILNVWVNFPEMIEVESGDKISFGQASTFEKLIKEKRPNTKINKNITSSSELFIFKGIKIEILSPTLSLLNELYEKWPKLKSEEDSKTKMKEEISSSKELKSYEQSLKDLSKIAFNPNNTIDSDIINASSISFILECPDLKILLLADSRPEILVSQLERKCSLKNQLKVDFVKISHHGSKNNTSQELLNLLECDNYIISSNGGSSNHLHPSRETIARIVYNEGRDYNKKRHIFFNYSLTSIKEKNGDFINDSDFTEGNWEAVTQNKF